MEQTQQREQKWGFWITMLNFFSLDSIGRILIQKTLHIDQVQFIHHLLSFVVAISLTMGIFYVLRYRPWKYRIWVTVVIAAAWLLVHII